MQFPLIHYIDLLANKSVKQNIVTDEVFIGAIRITENLKDKLKGKGFKFTEPIECKIKGKGMMKTFEVKM